MKSYRARFVLPVSAEPITDGIVTIDAGRIVSAGDAAPNGSEIDDLGNVAILPAFVNAHTHLDLTGAAELGREPPASFVDWIRRVIAFRQTRSLEGAVEEGLHESRQQGIAALGDIAQVDWPTDSVRQQSPQVTAFLELIAPTTERIPAVLENASRHIATGRTAAWQPGLSPHAPYTVHPTLLDEAVAISAAEQIPLAMHLAESRDELQLLADRSGPLRAFLDELGAWEDGAIRPGTRPLDYLHTLASAHRTLVIHGNYLDDEEIAFLAEHSDRMAVVFCPRTHAFFGHEPYPLEKMLDAGVAVAIGTDSRASSPNLGILGELLQIRADFPDLAADRILRLGTTDAAAAMGRDDLGSLEPGKLAAIIAVDLPDRDADPYELLFTLSDPKIRWIT